GQTARCESSFRRSASASSPEVESAQRAMNSSWWFIGTSPLHSNSRKRSSASNLRGFVCEHFATKPFQPPIVVIPCISYGLAEFGGDLLKGVSLKEEEHECLALIFGQFFEPASQGVGFLDGLSERVYIP